MVKEELSGLDEVGGFDGTSAGCRDLVTFLLLVKKPISSLGHDPKLHDKL